MRCGCPLKTLSLLGTCVPSPDADSDALLVSDNANRCVKPVAASGRAALVFQCGADSYPCALQLVHPVDSGGTALLLVEWLTVEQQADRYALVVAALRPALRRDASTAASGAREREPKRRCQCGYNEQRVRSDWKSQSQSA